MEGQVDELSDRDAVTHLKQREPTMDEKWEEVMREEDDDDDK